AWQAGLAVWVAEDAVASDDGLHAAITRRYLEARGVEFVSRTELRARLEGRATTIFRPNQVLGASPATRAHNFSPAWRKPTIQEREDRVARLIETLAAESEHLAVLMAKEIGKPLRFGRAEAQRSLEMLENIVRRARQADLVLEKQASHVVRRRSHGTVAVITPWNNPVYIALGKIVPAVVYGNAVVWKPAPEALMVSNHLFKCLAKADWPEAFVPLWEGGAYEAMELMSDDSIAAVTITGSSKAGYAAQAICANRRIPLQAELGGNNGAIVWTDADLQQAASMVAAGAFEMAGQRCTANRRAIVNEACRDEFVELLLRESAALRWGDPMGSDTDIGPLVSVNHCDRVAAAVERAAAECGDPLLPHGDEMPNVTGHAGKFYPP